MKVAFNKIKITPKNYIGMPLAGYTRKEPCLGKLDDIHAHGILIESSSLGTSKKMLLLISMDLLKVPLSLANYIKKKINDEFISIEPEHVLIHATHTHSAPDLTGEFSFPGGFLNLIKGIIFGANRNDRYLTWFTRKIVEMVKGLFSDLKPCKVAWTKKEFNPEIVINRRHPTRKVMPELGVITFRALEDNNLIGFIINYACHPTTLSFKNNSISADYPGRVIHEIDELTKNSIKSAFFNGAAADLNPITTCGTNYKELDLDIKLIYDQLGTYEHTEKIGRVIAREALKLARSIPEEDYFEKMEFNSHVKYFWIPLKDPKYFSKTWYTNKIYFALKKYFILSIYRHIKANFPSFTIKHRGFNIKVNTIIQYLLIKGIKDSKDKSREFSVMTVPGELFEDIGKKLLKKSPTGKKDTFIFQNTNEWIAYLMTVKEYIEVGGYEITASFSPLCGDYVEKEMLKLFDEIR
ncbi:MAG: hypothetical protein ACTSUT_04300 [Promethearchaeota archaeon]